MNDYKHKQTTNRALSRHTHITHARWLLQAPPPLPRQHAVATPREGMPKKKSDKKGKGKKSGKDEEEKEVEKKPFEAPENTSKELGLQRE